MRLLGTLAAGLCITAAHAGTVNYSTTSTAACSAAQVNRHDAVFNSQHRVDAVDPDGHYISHYEADGELWRNWEPVDGYKHAVCGVQTDYGFYVGPWYGYAGEERDTNQFFFPDAPFQFLIDNAIAWGLSAPDSVRRSQCNNLPCIEGEVTYASEYESNPWLPPHPGSPLDERPVCAYGPWVADHGHDGRPEIHPTETIWWPMPVPTSTPHVLRELRVVMLDDASYRYSDRTDDFEPDMPAGVKPWAGFPRTAHIRYAFRVPSQAAPPEYLHVMDSGRKQFVTTSADSALSADATEGSTHTLAINGVPRFTIVENQPDHELGAVFDLNPFLQNELHDICKRSDGTLQGYATLKSRFGSINVSETGFHELILKHTSGAPVAKLTYIFPPNTVRTLAFGSGGSYDSDGTISYFWTFGDGSTSTAANPTHMYASYGSYTVSLKITDNDGHVATDTRVVNIQDSNLRLKNGEPVTVNSRAFAPRYFVEVPPGASNLKFEIAETGNYYYENGEDSNLYVRFGSPPTTSTFACAPRLPDNGNETCNMPNATAGIWWIKISPEETLSRRWVTVKASYTLPAEAGVEATDALTAAAAAPPAPTRLEQNPVLDGTVDPASLQLATGPNGMYLQGDLLLTLAPGASMAAAANGQGAAIPMRAESAAKPGEGQRVRLQRVDLSSGSELNVTYASGRTVSGQLPGLAIDAEISAKPQSGNATGEELDAAWNTLLASMGARPVARSAGFRFMQQWNIAGAPHFASTKNGRASREDLNQVASVLNQGVYQRDDRAALTLDRAIVSVEWRDEAASGTKSGRELVHVSKFEDSRRPTRRKVGFTLRDAFGKSVDREVTLHSHGLAEQTPQALGELIAALAGVSSASLAAPDAADPDAAYLPRASERSALNRMFIASTRDGIVTPDELAVQLQLARRVTAQ